MLKPDQLICIDSFVPPVKCTGDNVTIVCTEQYSLASSVPDVGNFASIVPLVESVYRNTALVSSLYPLVGVSTVTGDVAVPVSISPLTLLSLANVSTSLTKCLCWLIFLRLLFYCYDCHVYFSCCWRCSRFGCYVYVW